MSTPGRWHGGSEILHGCRTKIAISGQYFYLHSKRKFMLTNEKWLAMLVETIGRNGVLVRLMCDRKDGIGFSNVRNSVS
jgi:hypothetical protein